MPILWPAQGVNRGQPFAAQPPGTCPNARNVRATALRDRQGGGKRAGTLKAFSAQAGGTTGTRVNHLAQLTQALAPPGATGAGTLIAIDDNFSGVTAAQDPVDLGQYMMPCYLDRGFAGSPARLTNMNGVNNISSDGSKKIVFDWMFNNGQSGFTMIAFTRRTTNDVTAYITANRQATAGAGGFGNANEPTGIGPIIRMTDLLYEGISARFLRTGANTVALQIVQISSTSNVAPAQLAISGNAVLSGAAGIIDDLTIRLFETGNLLTAVANWPTEGIVNLTATVTTTSNSGNTRAGVMLSASNTAAADFRVINRVKAGVYVPNPYTVYNALDPANAPPTGFGAFFLPDGWASTLHNTSGAAIDSPAPATAATQQVWPSVNDTANLITGSATGNDNYPFVGRTMPDSQRRGVDFKFRTGLTGAGDRESIMPVFRATADRRRFLALFGGTALGSPASGRSISARESQSKTSSLSDLRGITIYDGVITDLGAAFTQAGGNFGSTFPFRLDSTFRWTDDGSTFRLYINEILAIIYTPTGLHVSDLAEETGCGLMMCAPTGAVNPAADRVRIVQGESSATDVSEVSADISVYTRALVSVGKLGQDNLQACSGVGFVNALPVTAVFNRKWYGVDGAAHKIIDPLTLSVSDWVGTVNPPPPAPAVATPAPWQDALIGPFRLVATYRGRLVVARASLNPSLWAMSRIADPGDWNYLAPPLSTCAVIGSNRDVGMPGDVITALIPFSDDYLLFGCASSIWQLEGDPGYKGAVQNVSYKTGVFGPRSWCFDENGTLYFLGSRGLYRLAKGSRDPEPILVGVLSDVLDRIDAAATLVQMGYDGFKGEIHTYLTPTDGTTAGVHVVIEKSGAVQLDSYPTNHGPWGLCEIQGSADEDRRLLLGGNDGYVRRHNDDARDDDGFSIACFVNFAALDATNGMLNSMCRELQAMGASGNGPLNWAWHCGDSPEEVAQQADSEARRTGVWFADSDYGFQPPVGLRETGGAHQLRISQNSATETFALERIMAVMQQTGRRRV